MATSAPEAEVTAMAEGFATAIFLFDSLKEIQVITGFGSDCIPEHENRFGCGSETDEYPHGNGSDKNRCSEACLSAGAYISGSPDSAHLYSRTISES